MTTTPPPPSARDRLLRLGLVLLVVAAVVVFYLSGLYKYLHWDAVRAQIESWQQLASDYLLAALFVFFAVYVTSTALSLPVALVLSLVGGALFGRWLGVGVVIVASTCGASLAFLGSRYLFRNSVRRRFGDRLAAIDRGVERDGAWYLLTLRMAPYVPYFLINLALGLTPMPLGTFAAVTLLGMLPATFVIVNAGTELGRLERPQDALSPAFVFSLALLGLAPLLFRLLVRRFLGEPKV